MRAIDDGDVSDTAQMVKLVDTPASGAGDRKVVEVRVFFWAPIQNLRASLSSLTKTRESGFLRFCPLLFPPPPHLQHNPQSAHEKQYRL